MQQVDIVIDPRFRGPPKSGNGGYVAGVVGGVLSGVAEVTLKFPPPLGKKLTLQHDENNVILKDGAQEIAVAQTSMLDLETPDPV
ncbi:MAG: hypothetical protein AAF438_23605, partial [Pseudomonadota bacterium]